MDRPRAVGPQLYDRITGLCTAAGFTPRVAVAWRTSDSNPLVSQLLATVSR